MLRPRSTDNHNKDDYQAGETLFDFLKRKKKVALELSLSKSRQKENSSILANQKDESKIYKQSSPRKLKQQVLTSRDLTINSNKNNQETFRSSISNQLTSTTPRKVTFADQNNKKSNFRTSFIEMISPLKKKSISNQQTPNKQVQSRSKNKSSNYQEQFYRKNLNCSINVLTETLQQFVSKASNIKQKSQIVFLQLRPLLKYVQENSNQNLILKKVQEAKLKIRTFEHLVNQLTIQNGNQILEQFHKSLSEHILSLQSSLKMSYEKDQIENFKNVKNDKEKNQKQFQDVNYQLKKQIQVYKKKLEKADKQIDNLINASQKTIYNQSENYASLINSLNQKLLSYENQIDGLSNELNQAKLNQKQLQKAIKDLKFLHTQSQRRFLEQNTKVKSTKQEYLLNQLAILKEQFRADMIQLNNLHSVSNKQKVQTIQQLKAELQEMKTQRVYDKEVENKILSQAAQNKSNFEKTKKQNQCLVTDLHRMNEELYQHWMALKDIKTLSHRLQIYGKFQRIFQDLKFNDLLFV